MATLEIIVFFILAGLSIVSAFAIVTEKNMFHNILFFGLFLLSLAGFYFLLNADFLAMVQIFGYVGGVVVLILFVVMLTRKITKAEAKVTTGKKISSIVFSLLLLGPALYTYKITFSSVRTPFLVEGADPIPINPTPAIGKMLLSSYVLPFEILAVVLLVAIVGALAIVREERKE